MNVQTGARDDWQMIREGLSRLTVAFQPIANVSSGLTFGHEVLLRGYEALGCRSVEELLRACYESGALAEVETLVRLKRRGRGEGLAIEAGDSHADGTAAPLPMLFLSS
jgi:EAL domain-containing protein (putative c-di-GMP-specific phosphodiesterase class I)